MIGVNTTGDLGAMLSEAVEKMKFSLSESISICNKKHRKTGYSITAIENLMNSSYNELHSHLKELAQHSVQGSDAMQYFEGECSKLRSDMVVQYNQIKAAALNAALNSASFNLDYCIKNNVTYLPSQLTSHATSVQQHLLTTVTGWFDNTLDSSQIYEAFVVELQSVLNNDIEQYKRHLLSSSKKGSKSIANNITATQATTLTSPPPATALQRKLHNASSHLEDTQVTTCVSTMKSTIINAIQHHQQNGVLNVDQLNEIFNAKYNELVPTLATTTAKNVFKKHCEGLYNDLSSEVRRRDRSNSLHSTGAVSTTSSINSLSNNLAQLARSPIAQLSSLAAHSSDSFTPPPVPEISNSMQLARNKRKSNLFMPDQHTLDMTHMHMTATGSDNEHSLLSVGSEDSNHIREDNVPSNLAGNRRKPTPSMHMGLTPPPTSSSGKMNSVASTPSSTSTSTSGAFAHIHNIGNNALIQAKRRKNEVIYNTTANTNQPLVINTSFTNTLNMAKLDAKKAEEERISAMVHQCANRVNKKIIKSGSYPVSSANGHK